MVRETGPDELNTGLRVIAGQDDVWVVMAPPVPNLRHSALRTGQDRRMGVAMGTPAVSDSRPPREAKKPLYDVVQRVMDRCLIPVKCGHD